MKKIIINPSPLSGKVTIPSSKSICHRAVICAGLSKGHSVIKNVNYSEDIEATTAAMKSLGVDIERNGSVLEIESSGKLNIKNDLIDCNESGSTLRFLIPIAAVTGERLEFTGRGRLIDRPLDPFYEIFDEQGINYLNNRGRLPLRVEGRLKPGEYRIRGDISSQFISGLLFALPLLKDDSNIIITTPLESKPYVDLTIDMLESFSVNIENNDFREIFIRGNQKYKPVNLWVEGDFSQAAFWLTAGCLGGNIVCGGLNVNSRQGDRAILEIIKAMGGRLEFDGDSLQALPSPTRGIKIDASQCPDLVPVITVLSALSHGTTEIINAGRLRIKESDRLSAITSELNKIGADIVEKPEGLLIRGKGTLKGGSVRSWNDHRIAMALAVAATKCTEPIILEDPDCVKKSYPGFWEDFRRLGGDINEWNVGE